jgi:hypothetical protein
VKKILGLCLFFLSCNLTVLHAQKVGSVDFDAIKKTVTDSTSPYAYDKLMKRFLNSDTMLTTHDFYLIYYGSIFSKYYNNLGNINGEEGFFKYYNAGQYKKAIKEGVKALTADPLNMRMTFDVMSSYLYLKDATMALKFARRHIPIVRAIISTGNGRTEDSAFVVLTVHDEYEVLEMMNLNFKSQSLVGNFDVLEVETPNKYNNIDKVYFNITKELEEEAVMFKMK